MSLRRFSRWSPLLVLALAPSGCALALGLGDFTDETEGSTSSGTQGAGGATTSTTATATTTTATTTSSSGGGSGGAGGAGGSGGGTFCTPNEEEDCYDGEPALIGHGLCVGGTRRCNERGSAFGECEGQVLPTTETCLTAGDDDCDGQTNEDGEGCTCLPGTTNTCYGGPAGTEGVGVCVGGTQVCKADGTGFDPCLGETVPGPESCEDPADEDCDGLSCSVAEWTKTDPQSGGAVVTDVAVDALGNVVVVGHFSQQIDFGGGPLVSSGLEDLFIAKFGPGGAFLWAKRFGDLYSQTNPVVAVGPNGQVVMAGQYTQTINFGGGQRTTAGGNDAFVVKFAPDGTYLWDREYGDLKSQEVHDVAVDSFGDVVFTGLYLGTIDFGVGAYTNPAANYADIFVAKITGANGGEVWNKSYVSASNESVTLALDPNGAVLLGGSYAGTINFGGGNLTSNASSVDAFVAKLDAAGNFAWAKRVGDAAEQVVTSIASDALGNAVVTGRFSGTMDFGDGPLTQSMNHDAFLAKLAGANFGNAIWSRSFADTEVTIGRAVAVDASGQIVLAGQFGGTTNFGVPLTAPSYYSVFLAAFEGTGVFRWAKAYGDPNGSTFCGSVAAGGPERMIAFGGQFGGATIDFGSGPITAGGSYQYFLAYIAP